MVIFNHVTGANYAPTTTMVILTTFAVVIWNDTVSWLKMTQTWSIYDPVSVVKTTRGRGHYVVISWRGLN